MFIKTKNKRSLILAVAVFLLGFSWIALSGILGSGERSDKNSASSQSRPFKSSVRSEPDSEAERRRKESISKAAQKWYEELLEKYPDFKPVFRDVPDDRNGFLQFLLLAESLKEPKLPEDLRAMLRGESAWDPVKFKAWLAENKDYFDQILRVAELPDRSIKGIGLVRVFHDRGRLSSEFGLILNSSARLAFESGDQASALRYGKASIGLSNHFTDIEVPSLLCEVISSGIRTGAHELLFKNMLPALSGNPQALKSWREVLFRKEEPASEYARVLYGDWNTMVRTDILPGLLGAYPPDNRESFQIPDSDLFFDCYTAAVRKVAASLSDSGPDRLDLSHAELVFPETGIDKMTLKMLRATSHVSRGVYQSLGFHATQASLGAAAIAIMLGEEPPLDPVSGRAFQWDPQTRILTAPESSYGLDPIKVP